MALSVIVVTLTISDRFREGNKPSLFLYLCKKDTNVYYDT